MGDNYDYCKNCKSRYIRTKEDYNRFGEPLKTCYKCRIRNKKRTDNKSINKVDDIDVKLTRKCIECNKLWVRREKRDWESIECLKCYNCRAKSYNIDDIDIAHEIYPFAF